MRSRFAALVALSLAAFLTGTTAALAMQAEDCQGCHGDPSIADSGGKRLYIDPVKYASTTHSQEGCPSCHRAVSDDHPGDGVRPSKASCKDCHDGVEAEYSKSRHFASAICTDCHNPHAVRNPRAISGFDVNRTCANCHDRATVLKAHAGWLPQAVLHLDALPCITCHTGSKEYVITLYIEKRGPQKRGADFQLATFQDLSQTAGTKQIETLIDRDRNGNVSLAELRSFHKGSTRKGLRLWGMMMPQSVTHTFEILDNRWDCTFCHASGPAAMQTSFVAFPKEDGTYAQLAVEKGAVLDLLYGTPDFYMMGATRNDTLSKIGLGIILAGLVMPIGHGTLRFLTRNNRKEH